MTGFQGQLDHKIIASVCRPPKGRQTAMVRTINVDCIGHEQLL
jgi:hypothetical protein